MKERIRENLKKKKWPKKEIDKAMSILKKAEMKKPSAIRVLDQIVYWLVLLVAILGTLVISIILIPFMIVLNYARLYPVIIIIALTFGMLYDMLLRDLRDLNRKHYIIAGVFIPSFAIINMVFMAQFANHLAGIIGIEQNYHNPVIVGIIYVVAFVAPAVAVRIAEGKL